MMAKKRKKKTEKPEPVAVEKEVAETEDVCPKCSGYGFVLSDDGTATPCDCRGGMLADKRLAETRIPLKFSEKSLANFKARDKVRKFLIDKSAEFIQDFYAARDEHQGILMVGSTGSGKTHLAVAILREIIVKGHTGLYYNVPELLNNIRESYKEESAIAESDILNLVGSVDLLVMDDLGAERTSGWVRDRLYLIINRRYESMKPIIVTTNLGTRALNDQVGERIVSRLYEMCPLVFNFPTEDFRLQFLEEQQKRQQRMK